MRARDQISLDQLPRCARRAARMLAIYATMMALGRVVVKADDLPPTSDRVVSSRIEQRIVKTFDFNERPLGNYEAQPMNWLPMTGAGFPRFLEAEFDYTVGHGAAPSFHFPAAGGGIGAFYLAKDIPVHPASAYRVTAFARAADLRNATARLAACYLDQGLRKIEGSEIGCTLDPRQAGPGGWTRLQIDIPAGFERARWIGLSFCIEQPSGPGDETELGAAIVRRDVAANVWLDDITILRLPHVEMSLDVPQGAYLGDAPTQVQLAMQDLDGAGLDVTLEILNADATAAARYELDAAALRRGPMRVALDDLPPGAYTARLVTRAGDIVVSAHERTFLRLADDVAAIGPRPFGIVADDAVFEYGDVNAIMMALAAPDMIKLPLWRGTQSDDDIVRGNHRTDDLVDRLLKRGIGIVGVLADLPPGLAANFEPPQRQLLNVLGGPAALWRPYLALVLMRHGHRIHAWQIGADAPLAPGAESLAARAVDSVRAEVASLIGHPRIVAGASPWSAAAAESKIGAPTAGATLENKFPRGPDIDSIFIPAHVDAANLFTASKVVAGDGSTRPRWATIQPLDPSRYGRAVRLADFAQRLIECRAAGIERVFVPQPWRVEPGANGAIVQHDETFILLRTLNQRIAGLAPESAVWLGDGIRAWHFAASDGGPGALVVYADAQTALPNAVTADLGPDVQIHDLWGLTRAHTLARGDVVFDVDAMPVIVAPIEAWRVRMLRSFALDGPEFTVAASQHVRTIRFTNTRSSRLRGDLRLVVPPGWRAMPAAFAINMAPGETFEERIAFHMPTNQPAGRLALAARVRTVDDEVEGLTMRIPIEVAAPGLDVNAVAFREGDHVRVIHRITNRTTDALRLKAYLVSPDPAGGQRDVRLIRSLAPAQTALREYRLENPAELVGHYIRLTVEQVDGPLRHNTVLKLE